MTLLLMLVSPCEKTYQTTGSFPDFILPGTDADLSISEKNALRYESTVTPQTILG